jgi:peptide/nickel transport system permease protein
MAEATSQVVSLSGKSDADKKYGVGASLWTIALRRIRRDRLTLIALAVFVILVALSLAAPMFSAALRIDADRVTDNTYALPGSEGHILGTDDLGRDFFLRLLYAGQISLGIAITAGVLALTLGILLGVFTGYYGGIIDDFMIWFITTVDSIPSLYLLLLISALFRPSPIILILVLGLLGWTGAMRLVRGETLSLREREFVVAARAIGASPWRTMFLHIVPNVLSIIIVTLMLNIGGLMLVEAALSFLGFGVKPPTPTWGNMLTDAQTYFTKGPFLVFWPGLLIMISVLCLYIIGDGLRDAFDPKLKEKA